MPTRFDEIYEFRPRDNAHGWLRLFLDDGEALEAYRADAVLRAMRGEEAPPYIVVDNTDGHLWRKVPRRIFVFAPDNGEPALAFISRAGTPFALYVQMPHRHNLLWTWRTHRKFATVLCRNSGQSLGAHWHRMCVNGELGAREDTWDGQHPNIWAGNLAMELCASRHGCANGRGPEFRPDDPFIMDSLVITQHNQQPVVPPDELKCLYGCTYSTIGVVTHQYV